MFVLDAAIEIHSKVALQNRGHNRCLKGTAIWQPGNFYIF